MKKKYLTNEEITNYKNYKYESEDNTFLTYQYRKLWNLVQTFIPETIHPNILTICGFFSILVGFILYQNYNFNRLMGLSIFFYINFDGIDGIHARKTSNTSVIGEYFDHLIDIVNMGMITDCLVLQLGSSDLMIRNLFILTSSFCFLTQHYESLIINKMIFKGTSDISLILTMIMTIFLFGLKLPKILLNFNILFSLICCILIYYIYKFIKILTINDVINLRTPLIIFLWYTLKYLILSYITNNYTYSHTIVDTLLLLELTNYKIFKREMRYEILLVPILFFINPLIVSSIIINYIISQINKIALDLNINIFTVKQKEIKNNELRVFCCGVFDLCHLGHMMLFKKIHESFNQPIRLIVGIHSDFVCKDYKRAPIINESIRYRTVELCKYVDEVIVDCPLITTKEFLIKNKLDIVIIGEEYKGTGDRKWYPGAFELNNYKYIERFNEISSSDIIKKIKSLNH